MKYRILSKTEKELYGANFAVSVDYTDLNGLASAAAGTLNIAPYSGQLAIGNKVKLSAMVLNTPFVVSDSGNTLAITLGDGASANRYLASTETVGTGTHIDYSAGTGTNYALLAASYIILAIAAQSGKDVSLATAGKVTFYLSIDDLTALPVPS